MFREADRLDMISPSGVKIDLERKSIKQDDPAEQIRQVKSNLKRFREERSLYNDVADGPFCDDETFFRIPRAYAIYNRYLKLWQKIASNFSIQFDYGK